MNFWIILSDVVLLLTACLILGGIMSRLGQSPLIGYLLAGMFLGGPGSIHLVHSQHEIESVSELGVALLLFSLGLEFSINRLKKLGAKPLLGGFLQIVLTIVLTALIASFLGQGTKESVTLGIMFSLSSTAVVLRILMERSELEMPHGRNALAVLLTQDMAVVPLAILITILGGTGAPVEVLLGVGKLILTASGLILGLVLLNKIAVRALGTLTLHRNRELTVILACVMGLGAAVMSHKAGISPALGAFVAGMLLGSSAFATQIRADISPLRVILLTLFFGSAGMVADPVWIFDNWQLVAIVTVALTLGKLLITWLIFRMLGDSTRISSATGLCLAQIGEFAFVLGSMGRYNGIVSESQYALVVSVAIASFFLSAFLVPVAPFFGSWLARLFKSNEIIGQDKSGERLPPDVVIIGFGPAAQIASEPLIDSGLRVVVVDLNKAGIHKAQKLGFFGEVGDAMQAEVLEHSGVALSKVVMITIPHHESALSILEQVRQEAPHARLMVRSRHQNDVEDFATLGAFVVGDEEEVGRSMARELKQWLQIAR